MCFSSSEAIRYPAGNPREADHVRIEEGEPTLDAVGHQLAITLGRDDVRGEQRAQLEGCRARDSGSDVPKAAGSVSSGSRGGEAASVNAADVRGEEALQRGGALPAQQVGEARLGDAVEAAPQNSRRDSRRACGVLRAR